MDAVDAVFAKAKAGPQCWRMSVSGEALEFLEKVEARMQETGQNPTWTLLAGKLDELGLQVTDFTLGRHYRGRCSCPK